MKKSINRRELSRRAALLTGAAAAATSTGSLAALTRTPSQTPGPFYPDTMPAETDVDLTLLDGHSERAVGDVILVRPGQWPVRGGPPDRPARRAKATGRTPGRPKRRR